MIFLEGTQAFQGGFLLNWVILSLLAYSAYTDLKTREISNWITFGLIISGLLAHIMWIPISWTLVLVSSVFSIILYLSRFWSEADVKLAIGICFWLTKQYLLLMCFFYFLIVFLIGFIWMIKNRSLKINLQYPAGPVFLASFFLTVIYSC